MNAVILLIVIAVIFITVFAGAAGMAVLANRREIKDKQGKPFCGCGHHRAMHDPKTNECHERDDDERCRCRQYVGPEPLPSYYAPEIESGEQ